MGCLLFVLQSGAKLPMMPTRRGRLPAIAPDAARSGFLPQLSYVAPGPQRRNLAKRPEAELHPRAI